jgi:hypothetical protein
MSDAVQSPGGAPGSRHHATRHLVIAFGVVALVVALCVAIAVIQPDDGASPARAPVHLFSAVEGDSNDEPASNNTPWLTFAFRFHTFGPSFTVRPLWDAWNQCILDSPFPESLDASMASVLDGIQVRAWKNDSGSCFIEESRMHWMLKIDDGYTAEIQMWGDGGNIIKCDDSGAPHRDLWNLECISHTRLDDEPAEVHLTRRSSATTSG